MSGPFRTPAKVERAPIPPHGHNEWHPRPELLNALDRYDAEMLAKTLKLARKNLLSALVVGVVYVAHAILAIVHASNAAWSDAVLATLMTVGWWWVARRIHRDARSLRDHAYQEAERALEAKLTRDERPRALRLIINPDVVQRAHGVGICDSADKQDGAA